VAILDPEKEVQHV